MSLQANELTTSDSETLPSFDVLPLSVELRKALDELGYLHPTPVQRAVFDPALQGHDLVVQARTGTGKTAAFGMPLLDGLVRKNQANVQALVLCPTRELALQVHRELDRLGKYRQMRTVAIYGGAPMAKQVQEIASGAQIVVGTPGRVLDHLQRGSLNAGDIRVSILDESDEMLSMGFLPQINEIHSYLPESHQTLLFSATLPADIQRLAETRLSNPVFLTLSGDHIGALEVQHLTYFSRGDKLEDLIRVIEAEDPEGAIIFCNTRDETKRVAAALEKLSYNVEWLNADLAQSDREKVMEQTREGKLRFLVCTDVASRGIDISSLTHVINFDFPESPEAYVHRTGRTGRAGRTGTAISLITPADIGFLYFLRLTYKIVPIERHLPSATELRTREQLDLVDMFVEAFGNRIPHQDDVMLARRLMSHESAEIVLAGLLRDHLGARPETAATAAESRRARTPCEAMNCSSAPESKPKTLESKPNSSLSTTFAHTHPGSDQTRNPVQSVSPGYEDQRARRRPRRGDQDVLESDVRQSTSDPVEEEFDFKYTVQDGGASNGPKHAERPELLTQNAQQTAFAPQPIAEAAAEIFVSLGRRDGVSSEDVIAALQSSSIDRSAVNHISVRHHHTFVGVARTSFDAALVALDGANIAGRLARAEPAKSSRP